MPRRSALRRRYAVIVSAALFLPLATSPRAHVAPASQPAVRDQALARGQAPSPEIAGTGTSSEGG